MRLTQVMTDIRPIADCIGEEGKPDCSILAPQWLPPALPGPDANTASRRQIPLLTQAGRANSVNRADMG